MPRHARRCSSSGYYHLISRGVGKQVIFEETADYAFYLRLLRRYGRECGVNICAYCLMENHVHLLVMDPSDHVAVFMKKISVCYAGFFNHKYERTGHLFQGRYTSEPVEDAASLRKVFRYILNNPLKAGICQASAYQWSSYGKYDDPSSFVDTGIFHVLIGEREQYIAFIQAENDDCFLESDHYRRDDRWAKKIISKELKIKSGTELQTLTRKERNAALRLLKRKGLSIRQIERLTGISRNIVQRA